MYTHGCLKEEEKDRAIVPQGFLISSHHVSTTIALLPNKLKNTLLHIISNLIIVWLVNVAIL